MADENDNLCGNPPCTCARESDAEFCSAYCEGVGDTIELDCDCGHSACGGNF